MPSSITLRVNLCQPDSFQDALREMFKGAPWLLVSVAVHLAIGLVVANMDWRIIRHEEESAILADTNYEEKKELLKETVQEEPQEVEAIEEVIEEPLVTEEEIFEEEILDDDPIDTDYDLANDIIGVGGGGQDKFYGKVGRRRGPKTNTVSQRAVDRGLAWLASHQDPEGFWDCDGFDIMDDPQYPRATGRGRPHHDVGVTGLALLAFLGAGNTPHEGRYKTNVKRGVEYLCDVQNSESGCLTVEEGEHFMYDHALGTLALTEAYGLSKNNWVKKKAKKALEYIHESKNPGKAWRYNNRDPNPLTQNDVSVTGWMVMCLASARDFGLPIHESDIVDAMAYIDEMTDTSTGRTGYMRRGSFSSREQGEDEIWPAEYGESMTAVAVFCRFFCGNILNDIEGQSALIRKGGDLLMKKLPRWGEEEKGPQAGKFYTDFYYWYYGSYAMYQLGGKYWDTWKRAMIRAVVDNQIKDEKNKNELGSWHPQVDPWGDCGGRIYSTALCTLCLEVFYRYDSILGSRSF